MVAWKNCYIHKCVVIVAVCFWCCSVWAVDRDPSWRSSARRHSGDNNGQHGKNAAQAGLVTLAFVDTDNNPVDKVALGVSRIPSTDSWKPRPRLSRSGGVMSLDPGEWLITVIPTRDFPYSGALELTVVPGKMSTVMFQVREVKTTVLRFVVQSKRGVPLKQIYVSAKPSKHSTLAGEACTDVHGRASLPVPLGEVVVIKLRGLPASPYRDLRQDLTLKEERTEPLLVTMQEKAVSATCAAHIREGDDLQEVALTNYPHIAYCPLNKRAEKKKAQVYDGKFVFYDLEPGKYEVLSLFYAFSLARFGKKQLWHTNLAPSDRYVFNIDAPSKTKDLGSIAFQRWPMAPGRLYGCVSGLDNREGVKIRAFRVNSKGQSLDQQYTSRTNARGYFWLRDVVSGLYDLEAIVDEEVVGAFKAAPAYPVTMPLVTIDCTAKK